MIELLRPRLVEAAKAVGPLFAAVCALQVLLVQAPLADFLQFVAGTLLAVAGMVLLFIGIDMGILPMGRFLGAALPGRRSVWLVALVTFALGFATTTAEPDVLVLGQQVEQASGGAFRALPLVAAIAGGVGLFAALAAARIVWGVPLAALLAVTYTAAIALTLLAPRGWVPIAYDAGSVTTGLLSAPVILALALGLTSVLAGRSAVEDGFGVLGLASIGPVIVLLLAALALA